jgi:hypothetical protein
VAEEVARQLNVEIETGQMQGSEVPVDPKELLPDWQPEIPLAEGISRVIADARAYLQMGRAGQA